MRVSVNQDDAGYKHDWHRYEAYLNDELCNHCVTADEELGTVEVLKKDEAGNFMIKDDCTVTETLTGKVKIIKKESK